MLWQRMLCQCCILHRVRWHATISRQRCFWHGCVLQACVCVRLHHSNVWLYIGRVRLHHRSVRLHRRSMRLHRRRVWLHRRRVWLHRRRVRLQRSILHSRMIARRTQLVRMWPAAASALSKFGVLFASRVLLLLRRGGVELTSCRHVGLHHRHSANGRLLPLPHYSGVLDSSARLICTAHAMVDREARLDIPNILGMRPFCLWRRHLCRGLSVSCCHRLEGWIERKLSRVSRPRT
mmetsp:Transcript_35642/g.59085  ORF Transcript_35642/g.59085 Transcript_35642/m.59085 type:complete len:235 (+) Transcript_35642:456-1160(+)